MAVPRMFLRVLLFCILLKVCHSQQEVTIGIQYLSYNVYNGLLASGQCCDSTDQTGSSEPTCPPDLCDVAFEHCAERVEGNCDVVQKQETPVFENSNSEAIESKLGNGANKSSNLFTFKIAYSPAPINITISLIEKDAANQGASQLIGVWHLAIDWLDPNFTPNPSWRYELLKSSNAEIGLNVVSMCTRYYYGPQCSIYCKAEEQYDCLEDGSKKCKEGWTGPECKDRHDYCIGNQCEHNSTCNNTLTGYTCVCATNFTGQFCEVDITLPTKSSDIEKKIALGVGISLGIVALLALAGLITYCCMREKKNEKKKRVTPEKQPEDTTKQPRVVKKVWQESPDW